MKNPPDILKKILEYKREFVAARKQELPLTMLEKEILAAPQPRGFINALQNKVNAKQIAVIAEIKKASPSRGILRENFSPAEIAKSYEKNGATCLSVLTDENFFQGSDVHLQLVKAACALPILRKDFVIDPYQIFEARVLGADCILLIVAALTDNELATLSNLATELGLDVLLEVHDLGELKRALVLNLPLIGINNRNLRTFNTNLETTLQLLKYVHKEQIVVTESGINTRTDIDLLRDHGVYAFLIGETFMRELDPGKKLAELIK